jgi:hypothetical protein
MNVDEMALGMLTCMKGPRPARRTQTASSSISRPFLVDHLAHAEHTVDRHV